ncbi:MAG: hypothetical protein ABJB78_08825 [Betaproteobacteria bacterium]
MTSRRPARAFAARIALACAAALPAAAAAAPTAVQVGELCANADDQAHCGRLIEQAQMKRLPGLVERAGDDLRIALLPAGSGTVTFRDSVPLTGAKSYALWDYLDRINAVVLFTTDGEQTGFLLLQRTNGRQYRLPSEPTISPDRQRLVTADFCASGCAGELAVWRVTRDDVRKELAWKPPAPWTDASATWKDADTLQIEYSADGQASARTLLRGLDAPGWMKR